MKPREILFFFLELAQIAAVALVIVVPIRYFIFQPFIVKGASMKPNFHNGDYLIVDELSYRLRDPQRGEVIVFHYPKDESQRFIKRIIGLPNETVKIQNGKIAILDSQQNGVNFDESKYLPLLTSSGQDGNITLQRNEYFVMGDNRDHSFDSRGWGALARNELIGRVVLRAWPIEAVAFISAPSY